MISKLFKRDGIGAYASIEGWLTQIEANALFDYARKLKQGALVVEIGSWKGKSTYCLAQGLKNGRLVAIDPFNAAGEDGSKEIYESQAGNSPIYFQFLKNMADNGVLHKIVPYVGYSYEFKSLISSIDFLFIDGDHSIEGCSGDFMDFAPKLKRGGYIAFHDYYPERKELGSTHTIENLVLPSNEYHFIGLFDSLWIARKK